MVEHDGDEEEIGEEGREGLVAVAERRGEGRRRRKDSAAQQTATNKEEQR